MTTSSKSIARLLMAAGLGILLPLKVDMVAAQDDQLVGAYAQSDERKLAVVDRMVSQATPGERVRVIIGLDRGFEPSGGLSVSQNARHRESVRDRQTRFTAKLRRGKFAVRQRFQNIPFIALEIEAGELAQLQSMSDVSSIEEDKLAKPTLASSNQLIGSPAAWNDGFDGRGFAVAILDTGVDVDHPYFATFGKVVAEACFSTNSASLGATSVCPGGVESSTAFGSAAPCSTADCDHGTHVAGIAVGNDGDGPNYGVARGADLIAIQVFSDFDNSSLCGSSQACSLSFSSDQIAAMEYVYALSDTMSIASVNLSLGAGSYEGYCDVSEVARKAAIDNLRSVGIATVIASGNEGSRTTMQAPACISSSVSVGAVTDSDAVANFSNVASQLSLLAPGVGVRSAMPGGGEASFNGTSMATPHVAGAWALMKQDRPNASVNSILKLLESTGSVVSDERSGGVINQMRRVELDAALGLEPSGGEEAAPSHYIPLTGCRIVNTREIGEPPAGSVEIPLLAGKSGQDLTGQGGTAGGCGVSADVTAIHASISVIAGQSSGFLRAWPFGQIEPEATALAWNGGSLVNTVTIPVCNQVQCESDFVVKIYRGKVVVDLVIDVFGYYAPEK